MVKLDKLIENAVSLTSNLLEKSIEDPSFKSEEYLMKTYGISEECASRFYRPIFWHFFCNNERGIGEIAEGKECEEFKMIKPLAENEIKSIADEIIKKYGKYYFSNAEVYNVSIEH